MFVKIVSDMKCVCKYDPVRDLQAVDPTGYVDLVKANVNNSIDVPLALVETQFNEIDDPRSIGARPEDDFELMQANKAIVDYASTKEETSA